MEIGRVFGIELRRRRKAAGLTQQDLAEKAGLHRTYISLVERGLRIPTLDAVFRLGTALNVLPSVLLQGVEGQTSRRK